MCFVKICTNEVMHKTIRLDLKLRFVTLELSLVKPHNKQFSSDLSKLLFLRSQNRPKSCFEKFEWINVLFEVLVSSYVHYFFYKHSMIWLKWGARGFVGSLEAADYFLSPQAKYKPVVPHELEKIR